MRNPRIRPMLTVAVSLLSFLPLQTVLALPPIDPPRVIEILADKDNTFKVPGQSKPVIVVRPGETVILRITSHFGGEKSRDNYVHSFVVKKLRDRGWDLRLKEGTEEFTVTAPQATGEYLAECTVKCGRGHDDMNMKVMVKQ